MESSNVCHRNLPIEMWYAENHNADQNRLSYIWNAMKRWNCSVIWLIRWDCLYFTFWIIINGIIYICFLVFRLLQSMNSHLIKMHLFLVQLYKQMDNKLLNRFSISLIQQLKIKVLQFRWVFIRMIYPTQTV